MRDNPACPIADIFVLTGDIGGRGRGQERKGRGERPKWPGGGVEERRSGEGGEAESEGWSGGSDDTSEAETEEEGWGHVTLTALPWGTQESWARGLRVDAWAGRSDDQKAPSGTADKAGMGGAMGHGSKGRKTEASGIGRKQNPWEWGGISGGRKASGVDPYTHGVGGGGGAQCHRSGGKPRGGLPRSGRGGQIASGRLNPSRRGRGGRIVSGRLEPQRKGQGSQFMAGRIDSLWSGRRSRVVTGRLHPSEAEGPRGDETLRSLTASRYRQGEDGQGRGGGDENPPTTRATREQGPYGGDSVARRDGMEAPNEAMETAAGAGGAGYLPKHFNGTACTTTENSKHPCGEYNKVALEASERGQASTGPVTGEDGHRATTHSVGRTQEEGEDENLRRVSAAREPNCGETGERGSPERSHV